MPVVEMPDGALVELPDNPTPEQMEALRSVTEPSAWETAKSYATDFAGSTVRSLAGVMQWFKSGDNPNGGRTPLSALGEGIEKLANRYLPDSGEPGFARAAVRGAGAGLGFPVGGPVAAAGTGMASGVGGEAAVKVAGEGPLQRIFGGLAGGIGANMAANKLARLSPRTETIGREMLEGLTPEDLAAAKALQQEAAKHGVNLTLAQALQKPSNVQVVEDVLANSRHGNATQSVLRQQPEQLRNMAEAMTSRLPGQVQPSMGVAANRVQEGATDFIQGLRDQRTEAWSQTLKNAQDTRKARMTSVIGPRVQQARQADDALARTATQHAENVMDASKVLRPSAVGPETADTFAQVKSAGEAAQKANQALERSFARWQNFNKVPEAEVRGLASDLRSMANRYPNTPLGKKYAELSRRLFTKDGPITDGDSLAELARSWKSEVSVITPGTKPADAKVIGAAQAAGKALKGKVAETNMPMRVADREYARISKEVVDPAKQSVTGQLATPRGYQPDVQASTAKLEAVLRRGTDPKAGGTSDILTLARDLKKVNPDAFPDAVKTHLSKTISETLESATGKQFNPDTARDLRNALFKTDAQKQGLRDMLAGVADSYGKPRQEVVRGFENLMKVTEAAGTRPKVVGGIQRQEVFEMGGKSYGADALRVAGFLPFERVARRIEDSLTATTFRELDSIVATPEGVDMLIKLSKLPPRSPQAQQLLQSYLGGQSGDVGE